MKLLERIEQDFKGSFSQRDEKLEVLRELKSALKNKEIELRGQKKEISDEHVIEVLRREIKKRKEAEEMFQKGDRPKLAEKENKEMKIIKQYLPEELSSDKIKEIIEKAIKDTGATGKQDFGKVMGKVMSEAKGFVDGGIVKKIVEEKLSQL